MGGAERYAFELSRHMADVVPTRLVTFGDQPSNRTVGRLQINTLGPACYVRGQRLNPIHHGIFRQLSWADVIHCHQQFVTCSTLALIFSRVTGRPIFVTDHGGGGFDLSTLIPLDHWYTGYLHQSAYARYTYGHTTWSRASVISAGVDFVKFSPNRHVARERLVVYVGRLLPHKGVDDLIAALPSGLRLQIIGRSEDAQYLAHLKQLARGQSVEFCPNYDDNALLAAYRRALCVVLPSVYLDRYGNTSEVPELLGQTLIEGMACGAPVLCTAVGGMPEVVEDGRCGFVVPPNDPAALRAKLEWLRDNPSEVTEFGRVARQRVLAQFTWPAVVARCLRAYNSF